jgi:hypothetical protein
MGFTKKQLSERVKEETKSAKEYELKGFHKIAAQERQHARFFKMLSKRK